MSAPTVFVVNSAESVFGNLFNHNRILLGTFEAALDELYRRRVDMALVSLHAEIGAKRILLMSAADLYPRREAIADLVIAQGEV